MKLHSLESRLKNWSTKATLSWASPIPPRVSIMRVMIFLRCTVYFMSISWIRAYILAARTLLWGVRPIRSSLPYFLEMQYMMAIVSLTLMSPSSRRGRPSPKPTSMSFWGVSSWVASSKSTCRQQRRLRMGWAVPLMQKQWSLRGVSTSAGCGSMVIMITRKVIRTCVMLRWMAEAVIIGSRNVVQLTRKLLNTMMRIKSNFFKREYDLNKAQLIGQGNFAQVYRAFEPDLNDSIAIRRVKKSQADMEDIRKEKQINDELRKVENENILKIYDIIDLPEAVWYITEYCSGGSLWDALNVCKDNKMSEKEGLECVLQISRGVQELHNHRITHRDLKPQNILLKTKYVSGKPLPLIKLADFGLSTQKIIMETIAGTKEYIAPEQAKFHNYTNAVDVWSLGIIFDQILHGNPYYSGEDNKQVFNKILKMPFKVRDESLRPSIKELMVSLLKKKPYERPIIAVIRTTVEKILEEIEAEAKAKAQEVAERKLKSKSSNASSSAANDSLRNSQTDSKGQSSSRERTEPVNQSRKVYGATSQEEEERPKIDKLFLKKQLAQVTPNNRSRIHPGLKENELSKNLSGLIGRQKDPQKIMTINDIRGRKDTERQKQSQVTKLERSTNSPAPEIAKPTITPPVVTPVPTMQLNDKISLFKGNGRKAPVASAIKKEEFKEQIVDINKYMSEVFQMKKEILQNRLQVEKGQSFLPNTQMVASEFADKCRNTDEAVRGFKKQMDFLNYFSLSEDYEVRLLKGRAQLPAIKEQARKEIEEVSQSVEEIFFRQLDSYVDAYLERVIK